MRAGSPRSTTVSWPCMRAAWCATKRCTGTPLACLPPADRFAMALGVCRDGSREILGLWIETTEGAKFWMKVFNDLKTRGVNDILIAVTDGLTGMAAALAGGLSPNHVANVHRPPDPQQSGL